MINLEELKQHADEFNTLVQNALLGCNLPARDAEACIHFLRCVDKVFDLFLKEQDFSRRKLQFATIYAYAYLHYKDIFEQISEYQSVYSYTRKYTGFGNWMESAYLPGLKSLLDNSGQIYEACANELLFLDGIEADEDQALVMRHGLNEALSYKLGPLMTGENHEPAATLLQAERRAIISVHFERMNDLSSARIANTSLATKGALAVSLVGGPVGLLATYAASTFVSPQLTRDAEYIQRTLQRVEFEDLRKSWLKEMKGNIREEQQVNQFIKLPLGYEPYRSNQFSFNYNV
jgi:hypothetical protein